MKAKAQRKPDVELIGDEVLVRLHKCVLILPHAEYIKAWRRGKAYRRAEAMKARLHEQES